MVKKSSVAGIVDKKGGLRIIVAHKKNMPFHLFEGERLYILPRVKVIEPVTDMREIADLIRQVEDYVKQELSKAV